MNFILSFLFTIILSDSLFAFVDNDFDGVEDTNDACLDTPFMDFVDSSGCSTSSLISHHKFDIIVGMALSQKNKDTFENEETLYTSIQVDYNFKDFHLYTLLSRYDNDYESGLNDVLIGMNYTFNIYDTFEFSPAIAIYLPTYDSGLSNEKSDLSTSFNFAYYYEFLSLFTSYSYTFINDTDTINIEYQNTSSYQIGIGYPINDKTYMDIELYKSSSIYKGVDDIENISLDLNYYINEKYFLLFNYSYGLSESASDNYFSIRYGINF